MAFIQARNYTPTQVGRQVKWLVLHCTQNDIAKGAALNVANFFARQAPGKSGSSAHYVIDADEIVQCVNERDVAWAAPGANSYGIHFEQVGRAEWAQAQWLSKDGTAVINRTRDKVAEVAKRYGIPFVWLSVDDLKAGRKGITDHATVSKAFGGTHWDPGPNYPVATFMGALVAQPNQPTQPEPVVGPRVAHEADQMYSRHVEFGLDEAGNGWGVVPGENAARVTSIAQLGSYPPNDNYWKNGGLGRQARDGNVVITATGGQPGGRAVLEVWFSEK